MPGSTAHSIGSPRIDRPEIPAEYGVTKATRFVEWSHVEDRFTRDRVYWLATVGRDGRPRIRPVDGLYVDGVLYVGGSPETRWVRDVSLNRHVAVHLDGLDDVVMVEGEVEVLSGIGDELAERLASASNAKFPEYRMTPAVYKSHGAIAIRPRKVIAWTDITSDPTRFRFDPVEAAG
jgi:nitroimidazol reductase NimA-like FMN-containing flavoprotein (pyridoxamine 5'-phosphate oxidase superfamily)